MIYNKWRDKRTLLRLNYYHLTFPNRSPVDMHANYYYLLFYFIINVAIIRHLYYKMPKSHEMSKNLFSFIGLFIASGKIVLTNNNQAIGISDFIEIIK